MSTKTDKEPQPASKPKTPRKKAPAKPVQAEKEESKKALIKARVTPLRVPGAVLARGGQATIDLKTAEYLRDQNQADIIRII
ncbi:MAG: hypothetical protein ACQKBY_06040 [Verrucomicrobiales bacterium]